MTRKEKIEAYKMKLDGYTFSQIGEHFGVSKQCVQRCLADCVSPRSDINVVFVGLKKWMVENEETPTGFASKINPDKANKSGFTDKLKGKRELRMSEIKKIIEATGKSFEELFSEEYE